MAYRNSWRTFYVAIRMQNMGTRRGASKEWVNVPSETRSKVRHGRSFNIESIIIVAAMSSFHAMQAMAIDITATELRFSVWS